MTALLPRSIRTSILLRLTQAAHRLDGKTAVQVAARLTAGTGHEAHLLALRVAICLWLARSTSWICFLLMDPNQSPISHIKKQRVVHYCITDDIYLIHLFVCLCSAQSPLRTPPHTLTCKLH